MSIRTCVALALLLLVAAAPVQDQPALGVASGQEFVLRLRAHDELAATVDFEAASYGSDLDGAQIGIWRAELAFGLFEPGLLSFGFRDREQARLVDVGDFRVPGQRLARDLAPRPAASVLHTLELDDRKVVYRSPPDRQLSLREASPIGAILPDVGIQHVLPELGHVYLLRYRGVPETPDSWGRVVAFQVVELVPGEALTLRGRTLPGSP